MQAAKTNKPKGHANNQHDNKNVIKPTIAQLASEKNGKQPTWEQQNVQLKTNAFGEPVILPPRKPIQTKLNVGQPGDKFEKEADSTAETVVQRTETPSVNKSSAPPIQTSKVNSGDLQRMEDGTEEKEVQLEEDTKASDKESTDDLMQLMTDKDEEVQMMSDDSEDVQSKADEGDEVQMMSDDSEDVQMESDDNEDVQLKFKNKKNKNKSSVSTDLASSKGKGQPMDASTKAEMESGFGTDFSGVKIHTDSKAAEMNQNLGAKAFTNGADVYFNDGNYKPETKEGKQLLAHELTHTLQQGAVESGKTTEESSKPEKLSWKERRAARKDDREQKKIEKAAEKEAKKAEREERKEEKRAEKAAKKAAKAERKEVKTEVKEEKQAVKAVKKAEKKKEKAAKKEEKKEKKKKKANPKEDPNFIAVMKNIAVESDGQKAKENPSTLSENALEAAESPDNEAESFAMAEQVDEMEQQEPKEFSAENFKALLKTRIEQMQLPENNDEADKFEEHNNIDEVNKKATGDIKSKTEETSANIDQSTNKEPQVKPDHEREAKPLPAVKRSKKPKSVNAAKAVPPVRSPKEVEKPMAEDTARMDNAMAENDVTDHQLEISQEPKFEQALDEKNKAKEESGNIAKTARQKESGVLQNSAAKADATSQEQLQGMKMLNDSSVKKVTGNQEATGSKDTSERDRIAGEINGIYEKTKTDVNKILDDLDIKVEKDFEKASEKAKDKFETYCGNKMAKYKYDRYLSQVGGWALWTYDLFAGLPDEVNQFYVDGRKLFVDTMDAEIDILAHHIASELNRATQRIEDGKQEVNDYVEALPKNLKQFGKEAAEEIRDKFDELSEDVNAKEEDLVDMLAEEYVAALEEVDERIEELKAANRGLIDMAMDFINGVIETIRKLKEAIQGLLSAITSAISVIMADPIGFMETLFDGIGKGIDMFKANIQNHLLGGLLEWLTGALGPMGIQMPSDIFSLSGIFDLVMQVLGLGWDYLRLKAVKAMGEPVVKALESGWDMFKTFSTKGVMGIWEYVKDKFTDLKETVIDAIKDMLITKVIEAGIKWLLSLLIPGAGFIKAIMAIKDIIVFFVESAIMLIPAITDAILALASGNIAGVAKAIENGLAKLITLVIGLFAKLIGLGDLAKRVQKIFKKIRKRVDKAVRKLLQKAKKAGRKIMRKLGIGKKKGTEKDDKRTDKQKKADLHKGVMEATDFVKSGKKDKKEIDKKFKKLEGKYLLKDLSLIYDKKDNGSKQIVHVHGKVNPDEDGPKLTIEDLTPTKGKRILLVGEANFSFSLSLAKAIKINNGMVATSYDSEGTKYKGKDKNVKEHQNIGTIIEFNVDARNLPYEADSFEIVVFNFPWVKEDSRGGTSNNQALLKKFFSNAKKIVPSGGKVILSLSNDWYINRWKPETHASAVGLVLDSKKEFDSQTFPGYEHKMTQMDKSAGSMSSGKGITLIFKKP